MLKRHNFKLLTIDYNGENVSGTVVFIAVVELQDPWQFVDHIKYQNNIRFYSFL